jgi:Zn-dependent M16 (insulinase) family peptidase
LIIPAQVNYVGKGENLYRFGYSLSGSVLAIVNYLRATWLWERVRVQGGAYGGFCLFDHRSGVFTFLSYRDPNLLSTIQNYDATSQFLKDLDDARFSNEELTKAIIGAIGEMDAYQLPDAKGYSSMVRSLIGESDDTRQTLRDQLLATRLEDFHVLGESLARMNEHGKVVVMGSADAIQAANEQQQDWLEIQRVL